MSKIKLKTSPFFNFLFESFREVKEDLEIYTARPKYGKISYLLWNLGSKVAHIKTEGLELHMNFIVDKYCPRDEFILIKIRHILESEVRE